MRRSIQQGSQRAVRTPQPGHQPLPAAPEQWSRLIDGCIAVADATVNAEPEEVRRSQQKLRKRLIAWARADFPLTF
jgi:hypothetical protein